MTREARDKFQNSKGWTIGADAGVAVAKSVPAGSMIPRPCVTRSSAL